MAAMHCEWWHQQIGLRLFDQWTVDVEMVITTTATPVSSCTVTTSHTVVEYDMQTNVGYANCC